MKIQFKISPSKSQDLKIGDIIRVYDGSSITSEKHDGDIYIICAYPKLTGLDGELKDIDAEVMKVGIDDLFCFGVRGFRNEPSTIYRQDIQIRIGKGIFYTNSSMVYLTQSINTK